MERTHCAVKTCHNNYQITKDLTGEDAVTYFRCPKDEKLKSLWVNACQKSPISYVCSEHFSKEVMVKDKVTGSVSLLPGSLPSLKLPPPQNLVSDVTRKEPVKNKGDAIIVKSDKKNSRGENHVFVKNVAANQLTQDNIFLVEGTTAMSNAITPSTSGMILVNSQGGTPVTSSGMYIVKTANGSLLKAAMMPQSNSGTGVFVVKTEGNPIAKSPVKMLGLPSVRSNVPKSSLQRRPVAKKSTTPHILKKKTLVKKHIPLSLSVRADEDPLAIDDPLPSPLENSLKQSSENKEDDGKTEESSDSAPFKITDGELLKCLSSPKQVQEDDKSEKTVQLNVHNDNLTTSEISESNETIDSLHKTENDKEQTNSSSLKRAYVLLSKYDIPPNTTTVILPPDETSKTDSEEKTPIRTEKTCCVSDCKNSDLKKVKGREIKFHPFPKDVRVRKKWINWSKINKYKNPEDLYICSDHFSTNDYDSLNELKPDVVPTKKYPRSEEEEKNVERLKEILAEFDAKRAKSTQSTEDTLKRKRSQNEEEPEEEVEEEENANVSPKSKNTTKVRSNSPPPRKTQVTSKEVKSDENALTKSKAGRKPGPKLTGVRCCVEGCTTKQGDGFHFYPFPTEKLVRAAWVRASRFSGPMSETTAVCARHFQATDFVPTTGSNVPSIRLRRGTIPTKLLPEELTKRTPGKRLPTILTRNPVGRPRKKPVQESSSEDESARESETPTSSKTTKSVESSSKRVKNDKQKFDNKKSKKPKLGKKIEIIAELDDEPDGTAKKSYKVIIKKIRRKGAEGERRRGLLMDCKNSLLLVKKIVEGLDINRMKEVKFKPGDVEESQVVLTGTVGGTSTSTSTSTTSTAPTVTSTSSMLRLTPAPPPTLTQVQLSQLPHIVLQQPVTIPGQQQPLLVLRQLPLGQPPPVAVQTTPVQPPTISNNTSKPGLVLQTSPVMTNDTTVTQTKSTPVLSTIKTQPSTPVESVTSQKSEESPVEQPESSSDSILPENMDVDESRKIEIEKAKIEAEKNVIKNTEELSKLEEEMAKCKLAFELQRYKENALKQSLKIKVLQQSRKRLEKRLLVLKRTLDLVKKDSFMCVLQPDDKPEEVETRESLMTLEDSEHL